LGFYAVREAENWDILGFHQFLRVYDQPEARISPIPRLSREKVERGRPNRLLKKAAQQGRSELSLHKGWLG
jgi:hypothetical protein